MQKIILFLIYLLASINLVFTSDISSLVEEYNYGLDVSAMSAEKGKRNFHKI
jgi:hypothetical protein